MTSLSHTDRQACFITSTSNIPVSALSKLVKYVDLVPYVLMLLKLGADFKSFRNIPTQLLARELNTSIQNVYKILSKLESRGLIVRELRQGASYIKLTEECFELIKEIISILNGYLSYSLMSIKLVGQVTSGLGEGSYYMSIPEYKERFREKLGFEPFPGTLNVKLLPEYIRYRLLLEKIPGLLIEGFVKNGRKFGSVKCFRAKVENLDIPCAVLLIEKTHHGPEIIEVIAPVKLREYARLKDGDIISIQVFV